jgi:hypothetical protein
MFSMVAGGVSWLRCGRMRRWDASDTGEGMCEKCEDILKDGVRT